MLVDQKEFAETIDRVVDIAAGLGGYVAQQNNNAVTVRVPSGSLATLFSANNPNIHQRPRYRKQPHHAAHIAAEAG